MTQRVESNSSLSSYRDCNKLYYWQYIEQIKKDSVSSAISLGIAGHKLLESHYRGQLSGYKQSDSIEETKASALVEGYKSHYKNDGWKVIESEKIFNMDLVNPSTQRSAKKVSLEGKVDLVVEINGQKWLVDHKFKGTVQEREFWQINSQADLYLNAYKECVGVIWDIIRTPSIRVKKDETESQYGQRLLKDVHERPEFYYHRFVMKRWADDIVESAQDVWMTHMMMQLSFKKNIWPRNPGRCHKYGTCPFLNLCANKDLDPLENGYVKKKAKHEELEKEVM